MNEFGRLKQEDMVVYTISLLLFTLCFFFLLFFLLLSSVAVVSNKYWEKGILARKRERHEGDQEIALNGHSIQPMGNMLHIAVCRVQWDQVVRRRFISVLVPE